MKFRNIIWIFVIRLICPCTGHVMNLDNLTLRKYLAFLEDSAQRSICPSQMPEVRLFYFKYKQADILNNSPYHACEC